ncbi:hypothetical protein FEM33_07130 [Dyadobacter flavalbus]|uniref:Uncharacterized protein n=1 Tax=Dyadobacter flavalbus TaxID=2579942 RepID=A0A5M8QZ95_9BACT|nr:hypothetical protein FEM33_07130 [Dyadobacter flavalbus]
MKQFMSRDALNDFPGRLQKLGLEKMLEGEPDQLRTIVKKPYSLNPSSLNPFSLNSPSLHPKTTP